MTSSGRTVESPRVVNVRRALADASRDLVLFESSSGRFHFSVQLLTDTLWLISTWPDGTRALLRTAYAPGGELLVDEIEPGENRVALRVNSGAGSFEVVVDLLAGEAPLVRARTTLTPAADVIITHWARDLILLGPFGSKRPAPGNVDIAPSCLSASMLQLTVGSGSLFYFQNLSALAPYAQASRVSLSDSVGGEWPEVGFELPRPESGTSLTKSESVVLSDAYVRLSARAPKDHLALAQHFLNNLAATYMQLPRTETEYREWWQTAQRALADLESCAGCWSFTAGREYLNAYLSDYDTPPELMVQLAVLSPMLDFARIAPIDHGVIETVRATLESFYDDEIGTVRRWLPARHDDLDGAEEQKHPDTLDSWYLYHTLLNLGRLASNKDRGARKLFLDSIEYAVAVARRFKYDWPIFFDIGTLEVIKAESEPGAGGQRDVPGLYAHVMLQAWDLTGEQRFLDEAIRAGRALAKRGFEIFYQANVTAFGAYAMFRLWKITGKQSFLDTCYLNLANLFANMWLWNCHYGYGRNYETFLSAIPVKNAPYIAAYEEQEICATFATLLSESVDDDLLASVTLLLSEYIRRLGHRAWYSYPCNLPADLLPDRPKTGELQRDLWIPLEDTQDGWEKSGAVGQEVYGAALALGTVVRHYHPIPDAEWILYSEALIVGTKRRVNSLSFRVIGDPRVATRVRVLGEGRPRSVSVTARSDDAAETLVPAHAEDHIEFSVRGGQRVTLKW